MEPIRLNDEDSKEVISLVTARDNALKRAQEVMEAQQTAIELATLRLEALSQKLGRVYNFDPAQVVISQGDGVVVVKNKEEVKV